MLRAPSLQTHRAMFFSRTTVYEHEKGLRFKNGKFVALVEPGSYRQFGKSQSIVKFELRETQHVVGGQEMPTSDGGSVRLSLLVTSRISDPYLYYQSTTVNLEYGFTSTGEGQLQLHYQAQILVREWVSALTLQEVIERKAELPGAVLPNLQAYGAAHGMEVLNVQLMDFNVVGSLKSAQADILKAELEGKAAMQRARNESATLRSLVNSAKLTQDHPGLLELRILASGQKPRVTFMVGQPDASKAAASADDNSA